MKNKVKGKGSKENKSAKTSHCVLESAQKISADTHSKTISDLKLRISFGNWMDYKTRPILYSICCRCWKHIYRNLKSLFRCLNYPKRLEISVENCLKIHDMNLLTLFLFLPSFVKKSLKIINLQCLKLAPFPNEVHKNKSLWKKN